MKTTKAKRKLIPYPLYCELKERFDLQVPVRTLWREYHLNISVVSLKKILKLNHLKDAPDPVKNSYFPPWLNAEIKQVQQTPDGWLYVGVFPFGEWRRC